MVQYDLRLTEGFGVLHNSTGWRVATHCYQENVNGIEALKEWGIHEDSEEAFMLLEGEGVLAVMEDGQLQINRLLPCRLYVVAAKEKHALVLKAETKVLIMENRDMSRFETEKMRAQDLEKIRTAAGF